jgi:serine/threonine protein kinase
MSSDLKRKRGDVNIKDTGALPLNITKIASGKFGDVYLALDRKDDKTISDKKIVIKRVKKKPLLFNGKAPLPLDYTIPKRLDHPNIIKVYDLFEDDKFHYITMDYYPDGDLSDYMNKHPAYMKMPSIPINEYLHIARQIISAVKYLHLHSIYHLDIKLENIFVHIKHGMPFIAIGDFGGSITCNKMIESSWGTPGFIPPEAVDGEPHSGDKRDTWAVGVCLYALYTNKYPFCNKTSDKSVIFDKILNKEIFPHIFVKNMTMPGSDEYDQRLIKMLLTKDKDDRPDINEIESYFYVDGLEVSPN